MNTKRTVYLVSFTVLGLLIGFLVHAGIEIYYIKLLLADFYGYSFGLGWSDLIMVHDFFVILILAVTGLWGYYSGKFWWRQIYVLKKYRKWRFLK